MMFIDYYDIVGLNLFSELKVFKKLQIKEYTPIGILNYIIKKVRFISKYMHYL